MENFEIKIPAIGELFNKLVTIEQKLDMIIKPNPLADTWLDTKETAKALGISIRTLQEKRNRMEIPFSQSGNIIRYRAEDIQKYLMDHFIKSRS